ncbi:MAG TPA: DHA2 family efflux MFS transporter permease subunit [Candidatus Binataceae bacterium]|jgi:DHA2 family multidrug resistance protein|nr:DHA2 family efflux MFS transporter permease subunit [Candidatus Binataceae bacterium]
MDSTATAADIQTAPAQVQTAAVPQSHRWLIALAVMLGTSLEVLDTSIVNVALPHMQGSFSASLDEISWVVTSYLVANGIMIPMTGWISSRFGRKRYFLISVTVFVAASMLCGAAQSLQQMVVFRLLQGIAGAAMIPSSQAILMETFPPEEQQLAMAVWGMGLMVAPILGPTLGGWITDNWSWRWNFYINLPIGMIAIAMVSAFVHDPHYLAGRKGRKVDYAGMLLLVVALGLMQIVVDRGERADWFNSSWVVYATTASALAFIVLAFRELWFSEPVLDLRILKERVFAASLGLQVAMSGVLFGTLLISPIFMQEFLGYTPWISGLVQAPRGLGSMTGMLLVGQVSRRGHDTKGFVGVGFALVALATWIMSGWNLQASMWAVAWPPVIMSLGFGMIFPTISAAALSGIKPERMGHAASLYNMMRNTGAAIGIAYMTNILVRHQQVHQAILAEHFSVFDAWRLSRAPSMRPGAPSFGYLQQLMTGQKRGLGMVYGMVQSQSSMLAFNDIYRMLAGLSLLMVPAFLLLRGGTRSSSAAPTH